MIATEFTLQGRLQSDGFVDWICHRARVLALTGWVARIDATRVTVVVAGPEALIGAMEMACSLGPVDISVDRIDRRRVDLTDPPNGFRRL